MLILRLLPSVGRLRIQSLWRLQETFSPRENMKMFNDFSGSFEIKLIHPTLNFHYYLLYSPWCAFASPWWLGPLIITDLTSFGWVTLREVPFIHFCYCVLCEVPIPPVFLHTFALNQFTRLSVWVTETQTDILTCPGSSELWHMCAIEVNKQASYSGQNQTKITHIRGTTVIDQWQLENNLCL